MHSSTRANPFEVLRNSVDSASNPARPDNLPTQLTKSQKKNQRRRRAKCADERGQVETVDQAQEQAQEDQHTSIMVAREVEPQGAWAAMASKSPARPPPVDTSLPSTNECQSPSKQAKDRHGKKKHKQKKPNQANHTTKTNQANEPASQGKWEGFEELSPEEQEMIFTLSLGATGGNHTQLPAGYRGRYQNRSVRVTKPWREDNASGRLVFTHSDHNYVEGLMLFLDHVRHHPLVTGCYPGPITSVGRTRSQGLTITLQDFKPHNGNVDVTVYKLKAGNVDKVANAYVVGTLSVSEMEEMIRTYVC